MPKQTTQMSSPISSSQLGSVDLLGWRHLPHGADIGVAGFGPTPHWAFEQAAVALTRLITEEPIALPDHVLVFCEADNLEDMFVAWLNALAYEMAVRDMIFGDFVVRISGRRLCAAAYGEAIDQKRHQPACEIKGATYTALRVASADNGVWTAKCVVDV